jgi:hypothetical protein
VVPTICSASLRPTPSTCGCAGACPPRSRPRSTPVLLRRFVMSAKRRMGTRQSGTWRAPIKPHPHQAGTRRGRTSGQVTSPGAGAAKKRASPTGAKIMTLTRRKLRLRKCRQRHLVQQCLHGGVHASVRQERCGVLEYGRPRKYGRRSKFVGISPSGATSTRSPTAIATNRLTAR